MQIMACLFLGCMTVIYHELVSVVSLGAVYSFYSGYAGSNLNFTLIIERSIAHMYIYINIE